MQSIATQFAYQERKSRMAEKVKVFRTWSSPFALRVIWALKLKGIEYETIFEDLSNKSPLLLQCNPVHKKVPVLVHNGKPISESLLILEYIDETWKQQPSLLPDDPCDRAMARFWAKFGDDKIIPSALDVLLSKEEKQEKAIPLFKQDLKYIEEQLKGKKFFEGETIGYLDIALGWMANLLSVFEEVAGLKFVDSETCPLLWAWIQNFSGVPVIKENWPPRDKLVTKFQALREKYVAEYPK